MPISTALVIPALSEAASIGGVLDEVPAGSVDRVIVVCGHSLDDTARIARAHGADVVDDNALGYGAACWAGAQAALGGGAEVIAFLDGDYADPPGMLPTLMSPVLDGRADLVLGARDMSISPEALPIHARLGNRAVLLALRGMIGCRLHDLPSFKVVRAEALESLALSEMTYGWTTEMIVKAVRAELRITEISIPYRPRLGGESKVSGTVRGTVGAAWKLCSCAVRYARWSLPAVQVTSGHSR